ncbi:hypothetical protein ACIPL1_17745 [Pseudomonas sp. NPDC090202]|uniref:hypothetical protein n=1 Tax=unclassified Pseudomonas TaxID=196821 RepID=UPI00381CD21E
MRMTPHNMAPATASHAAINITMVIPRLIRSSGIFYFVLSLIDSLVRLLFLKIDRWYDGHDRFVLSMRHDCVLGYTEGSSASMIGVQAGCPASDK